MRLNRLIHLAIPGLLLVLLMACRSAAPGPLPTAAVGATVPPTDVAAEAVATEPPATELPPAPPATEPPATEPAPAEVTPEATAAPSALPAAVVYDLGQTTIIQNNFPEDSRFREMPVQLNGVMAVPEAVVPGAGPHPVVLILHGTHPGCPVDDMGVDRWPCDPEVEQPNFMGFEYLVRELAARGYVALAININAENTFGFGEPVAGERLAQIVDRHLSALAEAAAGGANGFGVALTGVADMRQLVFFGHSRGGEMANWLAGDDDGSPNLASPLAYAHYGYGPVRGLGLIAPAASLFVPRSPATPMAIIVARCDGDVVGGDGLFFFEAARHDPANAPVVSVILDRANHNGFNSILGGDMMGNPGRPDCATLLDGETQRAFLVDYAADFLTTIFDADPTARLAAAARLGHDAAALAPSEIQGLPARVADLPAAGDRRPIFVPSEAGDLTTHALGGAVVAEGVTTTFCPAGFYSPEDIPGSGPCRRLTVTVPGQPSLAVVDWAAPGGSLRFELPPGERDLSRFTTLSLRAAVDPLSPLNAAGAPQRLTVRLTDGAGRVASLTTRPEEPALAWPGGQAEEDSFFGLRYDGIVPLTTLRLPLTGLAAVDRTDIAEIALVFDQTEGGALFLADLELARPPHVIGAYSTLLRNAAGENAALTGIARLNAASSCTGSFVNPSGKPDAPAYLLTNGHCAQEWDANAVIIDRPAVNWAATFNYFVDTAEDAGVRVPVARVAYSTMKGRDVALLELDATAGELIERGIQPLRISDLPPQAPFELHVAGVPVTGVPAGAAYLREEGCLAVGRADLREFIWHFNDAIANACQDVYGGGSGSPVFAGGERVIVALMNSTNIGGVTPCALGAPCEVRADGMVMNADTSYATPVDGLGACFGADGRFDLAAAGCPLDDGRQLLLTGFPPQPIQTSSISPEGLAIPAAWNTTVAGDLPYYRYKTGLAGTTDCRAAEGYGPVVARAEADLIVDPLPPEEGVYVLCLQAGDTPAVDNAWQPLKWATQVWAEIDMTPPTLTPRLSILRDVSGGLQFEPVFVPPELSHFEALYGPADGTDCADRDAFRPYLRIPFTIPAEQVPARICVVGFDVAGNEGAVSEVVVGR